MLIHPAFDPVAFHLGPLSVHWYGLSYLAAFALFFMLALRRLRHPSFALASIAHPGAPPQKTWTRQDVEDILSWGALGVILGGRLGYCLFYKPLYFWNHPLEIFSVWMGGMSFHGGLLGVLVALLFFAKRRQKPILSVLDFVAPCVPLGLAMGRLGNFINGELWGRVTDLALPWAMVFPQSGSLLPRHPSQLYQFLLEGLLLFVVLWVYARKTRPSGQVTAVFLMAYGILRFVAEFFREPDDFLGLLAGQMSMGQWLCLPMVLAGALLFWRSGKIGQNKQSSPSLT